MDTNNEQDFTHALDELLAFYEALPINREIWWRALCKYPLEQVIAGFEAHITDPEEGKFPPKPAHIIGHIERLFPRRTGAYALYKPQAQTTEKRLPLTYTVAPEHMRHLMARAQLFAEGKGSREDKRDHIQELACLARGIATPLPYDPAKRQTEEEVA